MIFINLYILVFFIGIINYINKTKQTRKISCIILTALLSIIMGFRKIDYAGVDTLVYAHDFNRIITQNYSIEDIFTYFYKDYFFYIIARLFSYIIPDVNIWMFACAIIYISAISWLIYKYSSNIFLSYIIFISWQFYLYNFQLMRHVFSLAFVIFSVKYIFNQNIKKYILMMGMAVTSQVVSLIALPIYWIYHSSKKTLRILFAIIISILAFITFSSRSDLISIIFQLSLLQTDRFESFATAEGSSNQSQIINLVFIIVYIFIYIRNKKSSLYLKRQKELSFFFTLSLFGLLFYSMQFVIGEFYRVAQYFSFAIIVMIPSILSIEKNKLIKYILIFIITFFCVKHFFGGFWNNADYFPYKFYFE